MIAKSGIPGFLTGVSSENPVVSPASLDVSKAAGVYRVIHTADWHLGKTLADMERTEEHRAFLKWLLETIAATKTDVLIIAGDVFDSATPTQVAIQLYFEFLAALYKEKACEVIVTAGNHDSPGLLAAPSAVLRAINTRVVSALNKGEPVQMIELPTGLASSRPGDSSTSRSTEPQLVVAAIPYLRERDLRVGQEGQGMEEIQRDLRGAIRDRYAEAAQASVPYRDRHCAVLATGHLTVVGGASSSSEREIHIGGLGAVGQDVFPAEFDYVALGHLHRPQRVGARDCVRYSGSPIPLSFGEVDDLKEIRLLDFAGGKLHGNRSVPVPQARRLIQLRTTEANLRVDISALATRLAAEREASGGAAPSLVPWVEVVVTAATAGGDLHRAATEAAEGLGFYVLSTRLEVEREVMGLQLSEADGDSAVAELLEDVRAVFNLRLSEEPELDAELRQRLEVVFDQLHERAHEAGGG